MVTTLLRHLVRAVLRRPRLKQWARARLMRMPRLQRRLQGLMFRPDAPVSRRARSALSATDLPPRTLRIYRDLKKAAAAKPD